MYMFSR
jgi:hypothetical protein